MLQIFGNRWANDPATAGQGGCACGEAKWCGTATTACTCGAGWSRAKYYILVTKGWWKSMNY